MTHEKTEEEKLVADIKKKRNTGEVSSATLTTDDRVLARITDGIYRQPASALRELISNSYDADATTVIIHTDAPRFDQITIRDDGNGMDIVALARLIHHIGGSSKRTVEGASLDVTNKKDPSLSPKGRRLIGKIGIGLFSVSQLTRHFQIVTKVKGQNYRLIAEVILRTYTEDELNVKRKKSDTKIETGTVQIVSTPAEDTQAHGTEIILMDLRPKARELLQSKETWDLISAGRIDPQEVMPQLREPSFHIGQFDKSTNKILRSSKVPWTDADKPEDRFQKLYQGIVNEIGTIEQNPKLETALDNYLRMLWTLSLAAPVSYIEGHPFDIKKNKDIDLYELLPNIRGQANHLALKGGKSLRQKLNLHAPERGKDDLSFRAYVDDVELLRPIRFQNLPQTSQAIKKPKIFIGTAAPDLSKISQEERGGDLEFEAYFLWAPKIVPKENNGLLIRIGDASGTLFDETFAKYQISELTRLKQITAEIFVLKGLDAALNIDRESFNYTHPHYLYIMKWVHSVLRQIMNTLKRTAADVRGEAIIDAQIATTKTLDAVVAQEVKNVTVDRNTKPIEVDISEASTSTIENERKRGKLALNATNVFQSSNKLRRKNKKNVAKQQLFKRQIKAVAQILSAYGLLDGLTYKKQEELLSAIARIFSIDTSK